MNKNTYATADLALAAFLASRRHTITDVRSDHGRGVFVFPDTPDLREDLLCWGNDEPVSIPLRRFVSDMRQLKGLVAL